MLCFFFHEPELNPGMGSGLGFNAGNSRVGKFPGILVFPGNSIPGNKVRESRDFRMCVFHRKMTFFSSWSPEKNHCFDH